VNFNLGWKELKLLSRSSRSKEPLTLCHQHIWCKRWCKREFFENVWFQIL